MQPNRKKPAIIPALPALRLTPIPIPTEPSSSSPRPALTKALRDAFFSRLSNYRQELEPQRARWEKHWQEAQRLYWQDVTMPLLLRRKVMNGCEFQQKAYQHDGRVDGALCCDFMHWRRHGRRAESVLREFRRSAALRGPELRMLAGDVQQYQQEYSEQATLRLYASCYQTLARGHRPGQVDLRTPQVIERPALQRIAGVRIPLSFLSVFEQAEGLPRVADQSGDLPRTNTLLFSRGAQQLQEQRERYLAGVSRVLEALLGDCPPLVLLHITSADDRTHCIVCDMSDKPGIFDPNYGFMELAKGSRECFAPLVSALAYRYSARSIAAFQDPAMPAL